MVVVYSEMLLRVRVAPPAAPHGPFAASLPAELTPVLNKYCDVLELEPGDDIGPYLFHPPQAFFDRPMESSAWSSTMSDLEPGTLLHA